jgi:uncharacterized protein YkuJ
MLIEISQLPQIIQQQILQVKTGETVQFVDNGEVVANVLPVQDDEVFGILKAKGVDGVEFQNSLRSEWGDYAAH